MNQFISNGSRPKSTYQPRQYLFNKKSKVKSFQEFYQQKSKSLSLSQQFKSLNISKNNFIDQNIVDAIDQRTNGKRMTEFIKRKIPVNHKSRTQPIQIIKDSEILQDKHNFKIFSTVFNKERKKILSRFESSKEMKQNLLKKLGMKRRKQKPFFQMERSHIFSFQDQYKQFFRAPSVKQKKKRSMTKAHPFCDIYDKEARKVMRNYSFQKKKQLIYKPFGQIDYSAKY